MPVGSAVLLEDCLLEQEGRCVEVGPQCVDAALGLVARAEAAVREPVTDAFAACGRKDQDHGMGGGRGRRFAQLRRDPARGSDTEGGAANGFEILARGCGLAATKDQAVISLKGARRNADQRRPSTVRR